MRGRIMSGCMGLVEPYRVRELKPCCNRKDRGDDGLIEEMGCSVARCFSEGQLVQNFDIGIIGLGQMGLAMAQTLARAGQTVLGTDVDADRRALFMPHVEQASDVASHCAVIILSLPNSAIVEHVVGSILPHCRPGTLIIDTSTSDPDSTRKLAQTARDSGVMFVDAPVSGGAAGAAAGTLFIMAGGDAPALQQAKRYFDILGRETVICGGPGCGNVVKILNNALCAAHLALAGEALAAGEKAGLNRETLAAALAKGSGRSAVFEVNIPRWVLPETFDSGFTMGLMRKDVRLFDDFAKAQNVSPRMLQAASDLWSESYAKLADAEDFNQMILFSGQRS
jgi:3-hydroxyisobutyrate dehydrogenase